MDYSNIITIIAAVVFCGFVLYAAFTDIISFTISNKLNLAFTLSFLIFIIPLGLSPQQILSHFIVGAIAFGIGILLFYFGVWGGGDAKLIAPIGLWLGASSMYLFVFYTAIFGGIIALFLIVGRRLAKKFGLPKKPKWLRQMLRGTAAVPYGVALCFGALVALTKADWFQIILK